MIDVSEKNIVERTAVAEGRLVLKKETISAIRGGQIKKGDPLTVAEAAALLSIKTTFIQIPHCHPLPITHATVEFKLTDNAVVCTSRVKADYKTGVEMEALCGVSTALLTVWDMVKYLEKDETGQYPTTEIREIKVLTKKKGE